MWAGLTRQSREFLAPHATFPDVTQREEERADSCDVVREVTTGHVPQCYRTNNFYSFLCVVILQVLAATSITNSIRAHSSCLT